MSHVDEGELTAYADGAYTPGEADAQRIEAHLAECANCRNRLAQAQALSGRAAEILSVAAPASFTVPSFDELRAAAKPPRRTMRAIPLTWAASVLLAVGLGWFGRDAMLMQQTVTEGARSAAPAAEQPADQQSASDAAPPPAAEPMASTVAPAPQGQRALTGAVVQGQAAGGRAEAREQLNVSEGDLASVESRIAADAIVAPSAKVAAAPPPSAALQLAQEPIEYITVAEAERRNIALHRVPELEVLRVGLVGGDVRIEQKLPDGKVVMLQQTMVEERPMVPRDVPAPAPAREEARKSRAADMAAAPMGAAANQAGAVTVLRGTTRVTISAALPADSLRALAAKVR